MKLCLVTSGGGHLLNIYNLKNWWKRYDRFWVGPNEADVHSLLKNERIYYGHFPEHRHQLNALKNLFLAFTILRKERPDMIFSTGAGIAPPFYIVGKLLGIKLVFCESYDFIHWPTLSAKLVYPLCDKFLIQHREQKKNFPKGELWGVTI